MTTGSAGLRARSRPLATGNGGEARRGYPWTGLRPASPPALQHGMVTLVCACLAARIAQYSCAWRLPPPQVATNWLDWPDWGRLPRRIGDSTFSKWSVLHASTCCARLRATPRLCPRRDVWPRQRETSRSTDVDVRPHHADRRNRRRPWQGHRACRARYPPGPVVLCLSFRG